MKISFLQTSAGKSWSGFTDKNHLGSIFQRNEQVASKMISKMLATAYGTNLSTMLDEIPPLVLDTDDDYTWQLIGHADRNIPLVAAYRDSALSTLITTADTNIGAGGTRFFLVFAERWFSDVNIIVGEKNEIYPIQIVEEPFQVGMEWVYVCEPWGPSRIEGIPGEELIGGKKFSKEYSAVEDALSVKGGETTFTSPMTFRNTFSQIRMQYEAPGNLIDAKFGATFTELGPNGKPQSFTTWLDYQDWVFQWQFEREKNIMLYYGRANRTPNGTFGSKGKSGRVIRAGAGLREQMETSNVHYYNKLTADLLTDLLMQLSVGKLALDSRKFVIRTGEYGAVLFHKAISEATAGWTPLFDQSAIRKVSSNLNKEARDYGFQFTEFIAPNGISVKIEVDPMYDDPVRHKLIAPSNGHFMGGPAESYRMDIFDIGTIDGEPNIRKVYARNTPDITAYVPGLRDPFSPTGARAKMIASPKDAYTVHKMATCSAMIKDPTRTLSLIPSFLR